tara:strand:- start:35 stop:634 length:600 start_codon:yes stop_codon:yes gene_type:complete
MASETSNKIFVNDYIVKLQEQIEELQQENMKLKNNGGYVNEGCANHMATKLKDDLIIKLQEENKKLKEENKLLEEYRKMMTECDKANDFEFGIVDEELNPEKLDDMEHLPSHIKKLNTENKKLQELIMYLKEDKKHYEEKFIKERDENRRIGLIDLKEIHYKQMEKDVENYKEQIKKLKEDIKLKDEIISLHEQDEKDS